MNFKIENNKRIEIILFWTVTLITVFWFSFFINKGIDVTDSCYYCTKYKYYFSDDLNVKSLGTFLTDVLGAGIYHMFPSGQILALSICSWGMYIGSGMLIYNVLKEYVPRIMLMIAVLGGSLFSLTWVHIMNYNSTSMFVQVLAICVLIKGVEQGNRKYFLISGFLLGINVFFRLPNILQICIGFSVLWYSVCNNRIKEGIEKFKYYVIGIIFGVCVVILFVFAIMGYEKIFSYLSQTAETAASSDSGHGLVNMLLILGQGVVSATKNWIVYGGIIVPFLILWFWVKTKGILSDFAEKILYIGIVGILILYAVYIGSSFPPSSYYRMFGAAVLFITIVSGWLYRKKNPFISTVCIMGFLAETVLCIGTDNGWYYQVVFMIFPLCVCLLVVWNSTERVVKSTLLLCIIFFLTFHFMIGIGYAAEYVFGDAPNNELNYAIKADEYKGIRTSRDRAQYLDELVKVLEPFEDEKLLAYGDFNIGYVITDMEPFFGKIWSDLASYPIEQFEDEMEQGIEKDGYPVILLADIKKNGQYRDMKKLELIEKVIKERTYTVYYENEWYKVYIP